MKVKTKNKVNYGSWVTIKMIVVPFGLALLCLGLGFIYWPFLIGAFFFGLIAGYFAAARYVFSPHGENIQDKVQELLIRHVDWPGEQNGRMLDIGCGNGPLTIKVAQHFPQADVVAVDYWGKNWDYSMQVCQANAQAAGVADRVTFRQASAAELPFEDDSFDVVLSNLLFHEVKDVKDKRAPIREALRVLKPDGVFVFQDLFLLRAYFGTPDELLVTLRGWGVKQVDFIPTHDQPFIPEFIKLPFMLGTIAILRGVK